MHICSSLVSASSIWFCKHKTHVDFILVLNFSSIKNYVRSIPCPSYVECNQMCFYMLFTLRLNWMDVFNCCERNYERSLIVFSSSTLQGYTALHIAMQFGRNDIFEILTNVYSKYLCISIDLSVGQSFSFIFQLLQQSSTLTPTEPKKVLLILILYKWNPIDHFSWSDNFSDIKENDRLNVQVHKALPPHGTYQHSHKTSINQTRFDN